MKVRASLSTGCTNVFRYRDNSNARQNCERRPCGCFSNGSSWPLASRIYPRCSSQQLAARHSQVGQREQAQELTSFFLQLAVANPHEAELAFSYAERVRDLNADSGLDSFAFVDHRAQWCALIERRALTPPYGYTAVFVSRHVRALVCTEASHIPEDVGLFSAQQRVGTHHVVGVGSRTPNRVHQAPLGFGIDLGINVEPPLVALLRLDHLGVPLAHGALGRARRGNQRRIDQCAGLQRQTVVAQHVFGDRRECLSGQLVFLRQAPESQDDAAVGQPGRLTVQLCELAVQRHVVQRFFHRRVT